MAIKFTNNATSLTASPVLAADTVVTIEGGDVWMFPVPNSAAGDYFYATLEDRRIVPTRREIVKVVDKSGATYTVQRGQDNTAAHDFFTGAIFSHRLNAAALGALIAEETAARIAADAAEAAARIAADANLQAGINAETSARIAGDASLQSQLNAEISRAQTAEANLQAQVSGLGGTYATVAALNAEIARATAAEVALGVRIDNEITARTSRDNALQAEIDAINAILGALPGPTVGTVVQHGSDHVDMTGHLRVTFPTAYTSRPDVVAQCIANNYDVDIASVLVDNNGFDIWIAYGIPSVVPAPGIEFMWHAVGPT